MKIVNYDSSMNSLNFGTFKEKELDLFFSICYKMKNEGTNEIELSFQELKELSAYKKNDLKRFVEDLRGVYKKLLNITMEIETEKIIYGFVLFTGYKILKDEKTILIKVNEDYKYMLNEITKYTKFDLMEFVELKSSYSKNMFKILKQYESNNQNIKWFEIKLNRLKELLNIPSSYKMGSIDQKVLKPILEQLKPMFTGLKIEKIKKGVKVDSLKFTWKKKRESKKKIEQIEGIKIKKGLGEKEFLEFQQEEKENNNIKNIEILKTDHLEKEKKKISKDEYEKLYKEHLKEHGIRSSKSVRLGFDKSNINKYEVIEELKEVEERGEQETTGKKKVKFKEVGNLYNEFLKKYDSSDNPIMKKAFEEIFEQKYEVIDIEN